MPTAIPVEFPPEHKTQVQVLTVGDKIVRAIEEFERRQWEAFFNEAQQCGHSHETCCRYANLQTGRMVSLQ